MQVLFVSDVYFPRVNGVSTSIRTFRQDLAEQGVESVLVTPQYAGQADDIETGIVRVPSRQVPRDPEDRYMPWSRIRATLDGLRDRHFDLVHVHTPFVAHYAGVRFARERGIPVIATYHTFFEEYLHHYVPLLPRRWGRALARRVTRSQCSQVDALVAPSQPMRDLLLGYGIATPIRIIPTGLPPDRYVRGVGERFRSAHGIPHGRPLLLYVGRVAHEKNIDFLLRAFVEVRRSRPDALLVIAGEGPARAQLARQVLALGLGQDVRFIGYLDRAQGLPDCYAAADVFVFASRTETQGLVLLEAMAQESAVVSTAHLGTASILQPGCGAWVAPEDAGAFARGVLGMIEDPVRRQHAAAQSHAYAQGWSSAIMAQRMLALYREVCGAEPVMAPRRDSLLADHAA